MKMHGCGNTFFVIDGIKKKVSANRNLAIKISKEKRVDGVLFVGKSKKADLRMRIFDRDGTEEDMCGNGIRCFLRYAYDRGYIKNRARILTGSGIRAAKINGDMISVDMGPAREFQKVSDSQYFVLTGIPHLVYFKERLNLKEARVQGRKLRHDKNLGKMLNHKDGISIDFVKVISKSELQILTYEVGVEDVTKACGTGSTAAAYAAYRIKGCKFPITVRNTGGNLEIDLRKNRLIMTGNAEYL